MRARDARLAPAAVAAWVTSGVSIGVEGGVGVAPVLLAWGCAGVTLLLVRRRGRLAPIALVLVVVALVLTAVAAGEERRAPAQLTAAAAGGSAVELVVTVGGRAAEGRVRADAAGAPVLVFGTPGDDVIAGSAIGDVLVVRAAVRPADAGDAVAYLVFAREPARLVATASGPLEVAASLRHGFAQLSASLPGRGGELLPGLSIGDTSRVSPQLDSDMTVSSLSHLTAVSGSNCAVVVAIIWLLAAAAGLGRIGRVVAALVALGGFVLLVTPEPSVLRAGVMAAVALLALASSRPGAGLPVLCLTVIGLLVADPWLARSYGFALSVLATAGLLVLTRPIADRLAAVLPRWLALALAVPIAAQLACQPVLLLLDPSLPLWGVLANALAEPAAPLATILGLVACLLAPVAPGLALPVAWLAWLPASWIVAVAQVTAGLPGARSPWPAGPVGVAALVVLTAAVILLIHRGGPPRLRRAVVHLVVIALVAAVGSAAGTRIVAVVTRPADWQIALCDVGQGDAVVLRSAGEMALIDTGPDPEPLAECLGELGVTRLDLLVLTHYDADHVGGVDAVRGRVERVLTGPPADDADARTDAALRESGAVVDPVARGDTGTLGDLTWHVLWPPAAGVDPGNGASIALHVAGPPGTLSGLYLGDLGEESQLRMLGALDPGGGLPHVDVVKVAHHGSADQAESIYERAGATIGLIGVGENDYGHPTSRLLAQLAAAGTRAVRSDLHGLALLAPGEAPGEVRVWTER